MSIVKVIRSSNAGATLNYLIDEKAHNTSLTNHRSLGFAGNNVEGDYAGKVNARYLAFQYQVMREYAKNPKKKVQAHHLIFSFSQDEFKPEQNTLTKQSRQALGLVDSFLKSYLPNKAQYLEAVQCDSEGRNLHVHVVVNSVQLSGKVVNTNLYNVNTLRKSFDNHMTENFEKTTGKKFVPVVPNKDNLVNSKAVQIDKRGGYVWKEDLKDRIIDAFNNVDNLEDFGTVLSDVYGVSVKYRRSSKGVDEKGKKLYRNAITYSFVDQDGKERKSRDYGFTKTGKETGLGVMFTPDSLEKAFEQRLEQEETMPSLLDTLNLQGGVGNDDKQTKKLDVIETTIDKHKHHNGFDTEASDKYVIEQRAKADRERKRRQKQAEQRKLEQERLRIEKQRLLARREREEAEQRNTERFEQSREHTQERTKSTRSYNNDELEL